MRRGSRIVPPSIRGTPQRRQNTLPTKLQAFFFGIALPEIRLDSKNDLDLVLANLDVLHQRTDNLTLLAPLNIIETLVDFLPKLLESSHDQMQVMLQGLFFGQLLTLDFDMGNALAQAGNTRLKLRFVNQPFRVAVDQAGQALT